MLSSNNILSPAHGKPLATPTQDMVLGTYYLTYATEDLSKVTWDDLKARKAPYFGSMDEVEIAYDPKQLELQAVIGLRERGDWVVTTVGRAIFNDEVSRALGRAVGASFDPSAYEFQNVTFTKRGMTDFISDLVDRYGATAISEVLDTIKELGFTYATKAGVTVSKNDIVTPPDKEEILSGVEDEVMKAQRNYDRGLITEDERHEQVVSLWNKATDEVGEAMLRNLFELNPVFMMANSGARGSFKQIRQLAGMRGLMANPNGEIIERPIKSNFMEGLSVLEYFISTHGARKGLADTALRTADSGYLTRRLVDVSQDVIIREEDCGTDRGISMPLDVDSGQLETSVYARILSEDVTVDGTVVATAGRDLGDVVISDLIEKGVNQVKVRSVLTCDSKYGTCSQCYGRSLATGKIVDVGEAVGIIAAQSIGEPGTQLTMRTFHTGGVAGEDITHGLPRVVELFEARTPKGEAPIAEVAGRIKLEETDKARKIIVVPDDGSDEIAYSVPKRSRLRVEEGSPVHVGTQLIEGAVNPHEVLRILGPRQVQMHLVAEVQDVYRSQGVSIHDKHIEIIVRQMLKRVNVLESGETDLLPGELIERPRFEEENRRVVSEGGGPASARPVLMGITKASLATESWLSAASFQETTRVLTDAAIHARSDSLLGLKENVIIGKLIPAGTGIPRYRNIRVEPTEEAKAQMFTMTTYDEQDWTQAPFGQASGQAVPLEDYDYGQYNR